MGPEELKREISRVHREGDTSGRKAVKDPNLIVVSAGRTWTITGLWVDSCGDINIEIIPLGKS